MSHTLGGYLVERGALDRKGLDLALEVMKRNKRRLDEVLRTQRLVSSMVLAQALAHLARYPYVEPEQAQRATPWGDAFGILGEPWCRQFDVPPRPAEPHETFLPPCPFPLPHTNLPPPPWPTPA